MFACIGAYEYIHVLLLRILNEFCAQELTIAYVLSNELKIPLVIHV